MNMKLIRNYGDSWVSVLIFDYKGVLGNISWVSDKDLQIVIEVSAWKPEGPSPVSAVTY